MHVMKPFTSYNSLYWKISSSMFRSQFFVCMQSLWNDFLRLPRALWFDLQQRMTVPFSLKDRFFTSSRSRDPTKRKGYLSTCSTSCLKSNFWLLQDTKKMSCHVPSLGVLVYFRLDKNIQFHKGHYLRVIKLKEWPFARILRYLFLLKKFLSEF